MFASDTGTFDPKYPVSTLFGILIKKYGGTVVGFVRLRNLAELDPIRHRHGAVGEARRAQGWRIDASVPFGSVRFGPVALTAKQASVEHDPCRNG